MIIPLHIIWNLIYIYIIIIWQLTKKLNFYMQPESSEDQIHVLFLVVPVTSGFISTVVPWRLSIQFWYDDCLGAPPIQEAPLE